MKRLFTGQLSTEIVALLDRVTNVELMVGAGGSVEESITTLQTDLENQINTVNTNLTNSISTTETSIRNDMTTMDNILSNDITALSTSTTNSLIALESSLQTYADSTAQTKVDTLNTSIQTELTTIKNDIIALTTRLEEVEFTLTISEAEFQALQNQVNTNTTDIGTINTTLTSINSTLASINSTLSSLDSRISEIESNQLNLAVSNLSLADSDEDTVVTGIQISKDITLPLTDVNGATIVWSSNNITYITDTGVVTQPSYTTGNVDVTMTATVDYEGKTSTKNFIITVLAATATDQEKVNEDTTALTIDSFDEDAITTGIQVTTDKIMQLVGDIHGTSISWSSSNEAVFSSNGTVTRPTYDTTNAIVTLTATITSGTASSTKTFDVTVLKAEPTDSEMVMEDKSALTIDSFDEDALTSGIQVTTSKTMQLAGDLYNSTISWTSSDITYFAEDGTVVQPTYTVGDVTVTLTATITNGTASDTKAFTVTIVAAAATDQEKADEDATALSIDGFDEDTVTTGIQVTTSKTMQLTGDLHLSGISWASDNEIYFAADGTVTQPDAITGDVVVNLTATVTNGTGTATRSYAVTVLATA